MATRRQFIEMTTISTALAVLGLPAAAQDARSGRFTGASGHVTTGTAVVERQGDGVVVRLGADFDFDGAPDPKVALGADGYDPATLLGALGANTGEQVYPVPAGVDAAAYNEVWIWCERFNVPLGVAKLQ